MARALVRFELAPRSLPDAAAEGARVPADDAKFCVGLVDTVGGVGLTGATLTVSCGLLAAEWVLVAADDVVAGVGLGVCDADLEVCDGDGEWWVVSCTTCELVEVLGKGVVLVAPGLVCVRVCVLARFAIDDVEMVGGGMRVPLRSSKSRSRHIRSSVPTHWRTLPCIHAP